MRTQDSNFSFKGQSIYIGLDVHKRNWAVEIITESGYREYFTQESKADILFAHLQKRYKGANYYSVYESGFTGFRDVARRVSTLPTNKILSFKRVSCF